jgi:mannose-6-phosphate isomerase-like protein (cupin superfamily)
VIPISGYTIVNLKEIENSAGDNAANVESHFARKHLNSEQLGVSYFRYGPGFRPAIGHSHREQEEIYIVVGGSGRIRLNDEIIELRPWDAVRVAPSTIRALEGGPDGLEFIAVGTARPEGGDGIRTGEGWWTE